MSEDISHDDVLMAPSYMDEEYRNTATVIDYKLNTAAIETMQDVRDMFEELRVRVPVFPGVTFAQLGLTERLWTPAEDQAMYVTQEEITDAEIISE